MDDQVGDESRESIDRRRAHLKRDLLGEVANRGRGEIDGSGNFDNALRRLRQQKGVTDATEFPRKNDGARGF